MSLFCHRLLHEAKIYAAWFDGLCNIELHPGKGEQIGSFCRSVSSVDGQNGGYATLRMPSGEMRMINENCRATFGMVSNPEHNLRVEGKAGRMRWKGIRPTVRGTAMNPVDHPHGGGEGKHKGNIPQTPWAVYTRGFAQDPRRNLISLSLKIEGRSRLWQDH